MEFEFIRGVQSYSLSGGQAPPLGHRVTALMQTTFHRQIDAFTWLARFAARIMSPV